LPGCDPVPGSVPYPFPEAVAHRLIPAADGISLHLAGGGPGAPGRPALFVVPGYSDHLGRYAETFTRFLDAGHAVWGMDPRGHGLSGGPRGYVRRFGVYVDDLATALAAAAGEVQDRPWVLLAHSTGALVALTALLERPPRPPFEGVSGAIFTSPLLRIGRPVTWLQRFLAWAGSALVPRLSLPAAPREAHTHDPEMARRWREDPLMFRIANARWYTEARAAMARVRPRAAELTLPVLALQAGADRVVDPAAARDFFAHCPDARYVEYPGMYHEILLETDRARVWDEMARWLAAR
jgi:alpha-beta hydrolase superfamily lysophospholipase